MEEHKEEVEEHKEEVEDKEVVSWVCEWCLTEMSSKQALQKHQEKAVCMKKGYICLRCLQLWNTPSELHRHQTSQRRCKKNQTCVLQRSEDDIVRVIEKK
jgi:hypothetical protein